MKMDGESGILVKINYMVLDEAPQETDVRTHCVRIVILREDGARPGTFENGKVEHFPLE